MSECVCFQDVIQINILSMKEVVEQTEHCECESELASRGGGSKLSTKLFYDRPTDRWAVPLRLGRA